MRTLLLGGIPGPGQAASMHGHGGSMATREEAKMRDCCRIQRLVIFDDVAVNHGRLKIDPTAHDFLPTWQN
jgi:hypothetical protein